MRSLLKGIIIAIITVGIVVPAGYYSVYVYHNNPISITQLIPGNSTMVLRTDYNGTPIYAYNYSNTDGIVMGLSMAGFSSDISSMSGNSSQTQNVTINPVLYSTYKGYNIYQLNNVSLEGVIPQNLTSTALDYNYTSNLTKYIGNNTIYVAEIPSIVSIGSVQAVKYSIDALVENTNFKTLAVKYFNETANVSVYFTSQSIPIRQATANLYQLHSDFNIELNNATTAKDLYKGFSAINVIPNGKITVSSLLSDNWVNGTINVGIDNYYLIGDLIASLPTNLNYTQYLSGYGL